MNQRTASALAFGCSVAAAIAASTLMSNARAESPLVDTTKGFTSQRSASDVRGETLSKRRSLSSAGAEYLSQQNGPLPSSGLTRADSRGQYIAARDEVHDRDSESGSGVMYWSSRRAPSVNVMGAPAK
jgi:hypothetical protein